MIIEALKTIGVVEVPGPADSPTIMGWAAEVGVRDVYTGDDIPWCALWMAVIAKRAGKPPCPGRPRDALWAANWARWGQAVNHDDARLGDIGVFRRPSGGHVGLIVGRDAGTSKRPPCFHVLAGNQSDAVNVAPIDVARLVAVRRYYAVGMPSNVRVVTLKPTGAVSRNEA